MLYGMNLLLWTTRVGPEHLTLLRTLSDIGYDIVEIPVFDTDNVGRYETLGRHIRELGMRPLAVAALNADQNICAPDADLRRQGEADLNRMVDCAAALQAPYLSGPLHSALGVFTGKPPAPDELARSAEVLARVAKRGQGNGVRLGIEPLNRFECYLLNDTASTASFLAAVGSGAGILYDTFHAHIEEKDAAAAIKAHYRDIALVHISENDRSTPGRGQVRWRETFAALKEVGYTGPLVVEAFGLALPELSAATRIWRRMFDDELALARESLDFMRSAWEGEIANHQSGSACT